MNLIVKELAETEVAYTRHVGSYFEPNDHWDRLMSFAIPQRLYPPHAQFLGISLDDPTVVEAANCRHDACVTLPAGFDKEQHHDVQFQTLPGGLYALFSFYDTPDKLGALYQHIYGSVIPASEYVPDGQRHCLEYSMNNPAEDPAGKSKVDLYVPIQNRV